MTLKKHHQTQGLKSLGVEVFKQAGPPRDKQVTSSRDKQATAEKDKARRGRPTPPLAGRKE